MHLIAVCETNVPETYAEVFIRRFYDVEEADIKALFSKYWKRSHNDNLYALGVKNIVPFISTENDSVSPSSA